MSLVRSAQCSAPTRILSLFSSFLLSLLFIFVQVVVVEAVPSLPAPISSTSGDQSKQVAIPEPVTNKH